MKKLLYVALLALGVVVMMTPPVMAQEEKPFTIHGEVRFRGDYNNNDSDFDNNLDDGALFFPFRVRIAAEGKFSHNVSTWIEIHHADFAGKTGPFQSGQSADAELYQGNMTLDQLWSKSFSLRIGRQEIVAGNELLLGDLDFYTGISHDGGVGNWKLKKVNVMVWYTRPVEGSVPFGFSNQPPDVIPIFPGFGSGTQHFLGGYATWNFKKSQTFDVYGMDFINRGNGANFQTVGVRYAHDTTGKGFFWDVEGVKQAGQFESAALGVSGNDVDASGQALEGWFGYSIKSGKKTHRFYGRLESASGDKANTTGKNEGFIPLFGDFHNRLGHGDWFRMANNPTNLGGGAGAATGIQGLSAGYTGYYNDRHEFGVAVWQYKAKEQNTATNGKKLGTATDVWYGFNYSRNLNFTVSLSELSPDDALTGTGPGTTNDTVQRLYGQARLRF